eukprot:COSAG02_NODE_17973_length_968_cov_1.062140_1_plen_53_part_10
MTDAGTSTTQLPARVDNVLHDAAHAGGGLPVRPSVGIDRIHRVQHHAHRRALE